MTKHFKFYCITILTLFSSLAMAQNTISIQSTIKNISGEAVTNGPQTLIFKLYTVEESGTSLWEEMADVEVVSGIFSHELGSVTPLVTADFGVPLYLGVTVSNKELLPRTKLGAAPYAMAVNSLAANGESASFDNNGKFIVSDKMKVLDVIETTGITNTGFITSTGFIHSVTSISALESARIGISPGPPTTLDLAINDLETGITGNASDLKLYVNNSVTPKMFINNIGRVGIGTTSPQATLHVEGSGLNLNTATPSQYNSVTMNKFFRTHEHDSDLLNATYNMVSNICAYFNESVLVKNYIHVGGVNSWSDQRIKMNLQRSDATSDLALLNKIEITEYDHIDKINKDSRRQKRVIAQQIKEVLPNAVQASKMVIPNVYELAKHFEYKDGILTVQTEKAHEFAVGDEIDLKTPKRNLNNIEVMAVIDDHTFTIKAEEKPDNVFVYGKYVDDFLSVDYDAIAMLNVSASQEMYRMIMDLQTANEDLKGRLATLEALMVEFKSANANTTNIAGQ